MLINLRKGTILSLLKNEKCQVKCYAGKVWITKEGDIKDYIVGPDEEYLVLNAGQTIIQALSNASIAIFGQCGLTIVRNGNQ